MGEGQGQREKRKENVEKKEETKWGRKEEARREKEWDPWIPSSPNQN